MELKELYDKTMTLFSCKNVDGLGDVLYDTCNDTDKLNDFCTLIGNDLSKDWLQMIYQYYMADRKEKKQDYTPFSLAAFLGKLVGDADTIIDLCAGSGALTIQRWNEKRDQHFELYEVDEKAIPYLLFNCALRNIDADICCGDVLTGETKSVYKSIKGDRFAKIINIQPTL